MKNINKEDPRNKKFWCEEFMIHTTFNKCLKNCKKNDNENCANTKLTKDMQIEEEVTKVRDMEKQKCPKCGTYLVSSLYFAFCPNCGLLDDEDEEI